MPKILNNIALSDFVSYRIGGPAKYFTEVSSKEELIRVLRWWNVKINSKIKPEGKVARLFHLSGGEAGVFVLGGGTNVLISDNGYDGLVIHNKIKDIKIISQRESGSQRVKVSVGSGVFVEDLLKFCVENSLSGLSWAGGLPGTIGGAVRGNAGAFGGEIKDSIAEIVSYVLTCEVDDPATSQVGGKIRRRNNAECSFGYRSSIFKSQNEKESESQRVRESEIIIEAVLSLKKGNREEIENQINEKIEYRKLKHPSIHKEPNVGSTFKNIPVENLPKEVAEEFKDKIKTDPFPVLPAGKLISGAGMSGERVGDIVVSRMHPNYLVNTGQGKSSDVLSLIHKIKTMVRKKYQVELEEEITII